MTPRALLVNIIDPGLAFMSSVGISRPSRTDDARVMVLVISGQEAAFRERRQIGGPARSQWQFERGGGVAGVLHHPVTGPWVRTVADALDIPSDVNTIYEAMAWNDHLAVCMARLLLWTDAASLPAPGDEQTAWAMYLRNWRPGKPDQGRWAGNYNAAITAVRMAPVTKGVTP